MKRITWPCLVAHWRRLNCVGSLKVFHDVTLWAPNLSMYSYKGSLGPDPWIVRLWVDSREECGQTQIQMGQLGSYPGKQQSQDKMLKLSTTSWLLFVINFLLIYKQTRQKYQFDILILMICILSIKEDWKRRVKASVVHSKMGSEVFGTIWHIFWRIAKLSMIKPPLALCQKLIVSYD